MRLKCVVEECQRLSRVHGMCAIHYARWYRTGSVARRQPDYNDGRSIEEHAIEKLLQKTTKHENGCWEYIGPLDEGGYARVKIDRGEGKLLRWLAHRLSYEHFKGPIPNGILVCHECDNRACWNPGHLFLGTHAVNLNDMVVKGRSLFGEKANNVKLTERDVISIYEKRDGGMSLREIAESFGVTIACIHLIVTGRNWNKTYQRHRTRDPSVNI